MSESTNAFRRLYQIDVSKHIEKKGAFSYLSWPFAVSQLRLADPEAKWEVRRFDGLPYLATEAGVFVEVAVTVQGVTLSQIHPVLDGKNRPIQAPTAFDINTSIQRCLVKAIALHGLGLYVYAGEDLPDVEKDAIPAPTQIQTRRLTVNAMQQAEILKLVHDVGGDLARLLAYFRVDKVSELPAADYERVIRSLRARRAA